MSKNDIFAEIVNELTEIADVIRHYRYDGKNKKITTDVHETFKKYNEWCDWWLEYRLRHIAYSEIRGNSREQIEQPKDPLGPWSEQAIKKHKERYLEIIQKYKEENPPMEVPSE